MKRLLAAAVAVLTFGCELPATVDDFRQAVPKADTVKMTVPESKGAPLVSGVSRQGLEGETADTYKLTRGITVFVNGAGAIVLGLVKTITDYQPTTIDETHAVWGPYTEALSPNTWRLTVTKNAQDSYSYVLEAKAKTDDDTKFIAVLSGNHLSTGKNLGHGDFLLDMDAAQKLPEHSQDVGTAQYTYSHDTAAADVKVDATFTHVRDGETGQLISAAYKYVSTATNGGSFEFSLSKDFYGAAAKENAVIKSRWQQTGAGRSDLKVSGGDLGATEGTASECWDSSFSSRYLTNSFDPTKNYGAPSACAFATADYSQLRI